MKPFAILGAIAILCFVRPAAAQQTCESLQRFQIPQAQITIAVDVPSGAFGDTPLFTSLPRFCRVAATLKPSARSDIQMEVWLPTEGWNGKLLVLGSGNFGGGLNHAGMAGRLGHGYAMASTDTGHSGPASNTFVNRDVLVDFAYRAVHETTTAAKRVIQRFYGSAPKLSYFNGCSTGGRQGLVAAQRYPKDFNGIVAGAPPIRSSAQTFSQIWASQTLSSTTGALPREKLALLNETVLKACDEQDGVKDGVLENPLACKFDPGVLACRDDKNQASCLTQPQIETARKVYAGPSNPRTGESIYPGYELGSELGWTASPVGYAVDFLKHLVFKNVNWNPATLNFDSHVRLARRGDGQMLDLNPDLSRFTARGGKALLYQGWSDNAIPPRHVLSYYNEVLARTRNGASAVRLFMIPGGAHCGGGTGVSLWDPVAVLDEWVSQGRPPQRIDASRFGADGKVDRTRPLCPWPQVARYRGTGSTDEAASFECRR